MFPCVCLMYYVLAGIVSVYKWHWQIHQIKEISICDTYEMDQFSNGGRLSIFVISSLILHGSSRNLKCMLRNDCCCHLRHHLFNNWTARLYIGGIILIIVIRLRLYTKQVPLKVHIAFEGVINTIYMTNKYWIVLVFENMVY